jgi:hypothetical protein
VEALNGVRGKNLSVVISAAWTGINGAFFDCTPLTLAWLALIGAWCFLRRGANALLLPVLILVMGILYGFYGDVHHQGTIFVAAVTGLWIAWPTILEEKSLPAGKRWMHQALIVGMVCMLGYQTWNAGAAIYNDYRYPYCGAEDAAKYLKSVGADHRKVMGYFYGMVAVEAYFDHNIQANRPTAYFHHGEPFIVNVNRPEIESYAPDYIVFPCPQDCDVMLQRDIGPFMNANGYSLAHFSDGYLLSKRGWVGRQIYFIYRRN